jgi:Tol biopolymer transport system component
VSGNISDAEISPDGSYLAYLEKSPDPEKWMVKTLQVMNLETSEFLPTSSVPDDINAFTWYKDSASITYSRKNYDYCMDFVDRQISGLYQFNIASDETTRLHIGTDQYIFWVEEWSPDGRYLLFSHAPDCSEGQMLTYYDVQTNEVNGIPFAEASWSPESDSLVGNDIWYWEPEEFPLAKYTISSGDQINLYSQKDEYVNNPKWSPNGEWITFSRSHINPDNSDILLLNVNTNEIEVLPTQNAHTELWNTYGNMIILSVFQDDFSKDIYCYDIDTGTIDKLLSGIDNVYQWVDE